MRLLLGKPAELGRTKGNQVKMFPLYNSRLFGVRISPAWSSPLMVSER